MENALLLNSTYEPLGVIHWQRAIRLLCLEKAEVLETYPIFLRSERSDMRSPSVVRLLTMARWRRPAVKFSRINVLRRDDYRCQYCGVHCSPSKITVDHVVPQSRGGQSTWKNLVACCSKCNHKKDNRTPDEAGLKLLTKPVRPAWMETFSFGAKEEWKAYIGRT